MKPLGRSRAESNPAGAEFMGWSASLSGPNFVLALAIESETPPGDSGDSSPSAALGAARRFGNQPSKGQANMQVLAASHLQENIRYNLLAGFVSAPVAERGR